MSGGGSSKLALIRMLSSARAMSGPKIPRFVVLPAYSYLSVFIAHQTFGEAEPWKGCVFILFYQSFHPVSLVEGLLLTPLSL